MKASNQKYLTYFTLVVTTALLVLVGVVIWHLLEHKRASAEIQLSNINATSLDFKKLIRPTFFNIEDFGGSIDKEDNSEALQAAIDAAIVVNKKLREDDKWDIYIGKVYIPSGIWKFQEGVKSDYGVEIFGDGISKTYMEYNGEGVFLDFSSEKEKFDLKLRDFFIKQNTSNSTAISLAQTNRNSHIDNIIVEGGGVGIALENCFTTRFSSFFIYNTKDFGVFAKNSTNTDFVDFKIENCTIGAKFTNSETNSAAGLKLISGVFQGCRNEGLILEDITNFASFSTFFEGNGRSTGRSQILATSDLNGEYDNDIVAFYSPFITGGFSSSSNSTAVLVENTKNFVFKEGFIRSNDKIKIGIQIGKNVDNAELVNNKFSGVQEDIIVEEKATNMVLDVELRHGRGYGRSFLGLGSESKKTNNRHYLESFQGLFGKNDGQRVGIGTYDGRPSLQGFGSGSSFNLFTNPKAGNHISAPNGYTQISGLKLGTTITSSNYKTDQKTHTVLVDSSEGDRKVDISTTEEQVQRYLTIKNTGASGHLVNVKSATTSIENKRTLQLKDGESVSLVHDGNQWRIVSLFSPL
ncbi:glycosyl hydrolase family 28-related protein [Croceivirga thetidis]|uniref:Rhamnogalacturonase A/B/Epimerase-like pectate lyase domain-containing protein n=1 Tax=Croceivirga thetidis TaxID=2721623 RepID=A0ABX1GQZ3_9FLAO|nr:glycosyl hydrolase family 28-related protein [Croceivirga thetidis]NKI31197.1 hypothetical protein [Croceivirga thetidis]